MKLSDKLFFSCKGWNDAYWMIHHNVSKIMKDKVGADLENELMGMLHDDLLHDELVQELEIHLHEITSNEILIV